MVETSTPGPQVDGEKVLPYGGRLFGRLSTDLAIKRIGVAKQTFDWMDAQLFHKLYCWSRFRHPRKTGGGVSRYWKRRGNRKNFGDGTAWLAKYADTPIKRHIKSLP
ncbi:MAG: hypothetical protein SXV54_27745 [Chloroflexota bacterium]|nr:hypothetical protein [Chloroflexota bacterium]